jgi:Cytochrome P460
LKRLAFAIVVLSALVGLATYQATGAEKSGGPAAPVFGEKIFSGYRDWKLISVAHEKGNLDDIRAILGNDKAIEAYRAGKSSFPDGAIDARLA